MPNATLAYKKVGHDRPRHRPSAIMLSPFVLLSVMLAPSLVLGKPLFAGDSLVKMLDAESFQSMLEPNVREFYP